MSGANISWPVAERLWETAHAISQYEPEASASMGALCAEAAGTITELLEALADAQKFITQPLRLDTPSGGPKTATYRVENYNALTGKIRAAIAKARGAA